MDILSNRKYSFSSNILAEDTFAVIHFTGEEGLSKLYRFDITLVGEDADIDLAAVVNAGAVFTIHRPTGKDITFRGIVSSFEQQRAVDGYVFFKAVLVPRLWWLTLTHHNQVFLDKNVQDITDAVLKDAGLTELDFNFRLQGKYKPLSYVCQYGESHFRFMSRWLTREGIYYYFEQHGNGEKIIFTDTVIAHTDSRYGGTLRLSPPSGLDGGHREEAVQGLMCRQTALPNKILLKDYYYERPTLELTGSAVVDPNGRGEIYIYGEHFRTPEAANRLAAIRAQALQCRKAEYLGESTVPYLGSGFTFTMEGHYRGSFNQKYLAIEVRHEGSQAGYLSAGLQGGLTEKDRQVYYRNQFTAIPATAQFRAAPVDTPPKIGGTLSAKIDAAGSGKYAELDEQGRYKVTLPFDLSGRSAGRASTYLRMIQPYTGTDFGMHLPLHKGTEVLLAFIDGHPDRPVIAGAVPNPETPSQVTAKNQDKGRIKSSGGNVIEFNDQEGHERITISSPCQKSTVNVGDTDEKDGLHGALGFDGVGGGISALIGYKLLLVKAGFELAGLIGHAAGSDILGTGADPRRGVTLHTDNGLVISARKKEETIGGVTQPGYVISSMTGFRSISGKGYSEDSFIGWANESVMGKHSKEIVGTSETSHIGLRQYIATKRRELIATATEIKGTVDKIGESVTELTGKISKWYAERNVVGEEDIEMAEQLTQVTGNDSRMAGESRRVSGDMDALYAELTEVTGQSTTIAEDETRTVASRTVMAGDSTIIDGSRTKMSGETVTMSDIQSFLSAEIEML